MDEGLSNESVENFMNSAKGTFIKSDGSVISSEKMSKNEFLKSSYEYGIGAYIHLDEDPEDPYVKITHYELIKRNPFAEYNPGLSDYQLYKVYPVKKYKRS